MTLGKRLRRLCLLFLAVYAALFLFRLGYGFVAYPDGAEETGYAISMDMRRLDAPLPQSKRNYASEKQMSAPAAAPALHSTEQKFEKTASITSKTQAFTEDERQVRSLIETHKGIVQDEQASGNKGERQLHLIIGVTPEQFDVFYEAMRKVGTITSTSTNKQDKTNEFLALKAKRTSLESTRAALIELKKGQGRIDEFIQLQSRILEVEQELQNIGVSLGDFDEVNAFCTVRFSLYEDTAVVQERISMLHRIRVAFVWATEYFVVGMGFLLLVGVTAFIVLVVIDRFKLLAKLLDRLEK